MHCGGDEECCNAHSHGKRFLLIIALFTSNLLLFLLIQQISHTLQTNVQCRSIM